MIADAEPEGDAQRGPSLAGYVAVAIALFALAVLLCATGAFDPRIVQLWNPAIVAPAALGFVYVEPRPPLWQVICAGAVLGLAYAALVLGADALNLLELFVSPGDVLLGAVGAGVAAALVGGLLLRWFARPIHGRG